jgi:L-malate glycosyltransferase
MKILFLTPWYPYEQSVNHGIFVQDQAAALACDHEVVVVASEVDYTHFGLSHFKVEKSVQRKITEHRITVRRSLPLYNQFNHFLITLRYARQVSREFNPDIIHGNIGYPGAFWAFVISFFSGSPFVVTEHSSQFNRHFRSWFHKMLTVLPMRKADRLIAVSTHTANEIFKYVRRRPVVVGNIIDFEKFGEPESRNVEAVCHLGFLGVLANDKKGLDLLLNAMSGIEANYVLHIGGGGSQLEFYQAMASDLAIDHKCKFHGWVAHWEVPEFMTQLNFFVSASRFESFGMVMVEAMAMGLPVVATDSGGPKDFINEMNGILVPSENVERLRAGILQMINSYSSYDPRAIHKFAKDNYSVDVFVNKMNVVYDRVFHSQG